MASSYNDGQGIAGMRRTCTYRTANESTITVMLTSGAQVLGFVDGENAAFDANTGYQSSQKMTKEVIPIFGRGNDAWVLKGGGILSALYKKNAIVIAAPRATVAQLKALALATFGLPSPSNV